MRKLALRDEVLMQVEKPARYIGNEINMVKKNPREVDVRFCMCFPDMRLECHILEYRFYMICLTAGMTPIVKGFILRGRTWTRYCVRKIFPCLLWRARSRFGRLIFLVLRFSMKCVIPTFCRSWICRTFRCTPVREHGTTRL